MFTAKRFLSKVWLSGLLIGLLFIFISSIGVPVTKAATTPKITVKAGFQNFYKENSWLPIRVDVSLPNGSPDFDGWIEASWANFAADNFVYRRHLQLTPPINRTVWLYLPSDNRSLTQVQFRMTDATGSVLSQQNFNVTPLDSGDFLLGVISDDQSALSNLNQQRLSQAFNFGSGVFSYYNYGSNNSRPGRAGSKPLIQVVHLAPGDLPTEMAGWDGLDGLALTDLTSLQLNDQSLNRDSLSQAAAGWLAQGRFLLVAGDSGVRRSGFLSSLLPVKLVNAPQTGPFPAALNQFVKSDPAPAQVLVAQAGTVNGTSAAVVDANSQPLLASRPFGLGISWFLATDFRGLPDSINNQIWRYALGSYEPHIGYAEAARLTDSSYFSERWLSQINPNPSPADSNFKSFNVVGLILLAYIILLGPVTYFVLKRWSKRERGWLIIPILALLFSASFLVVSLSLGGDPLIFSRVAIVTAGQTNEGTIGGSTVGTSVIYANNMAVFGLSTSEQAVAYPMDAINTENYYDDFQDTPATNTALLTVQQGASGGYDALNLSLGQSTSFEFEQNGTSGLVQGITTNLTVNPNNSDELEGTLQNQGNSDWQNISVWKPGGQIYSFDELKAGQKVTLSPAAKVKQSNQLVQSLIGRNPSYRYAPRSQSNSDDIGLNQKASILAVLLGNDGEALPKNTDRLYLIAWKQNITDYGLQIGNHPVKTNDLTLLFEPIAIK